MKGRPNPHSIGSVITVPHQDEKLSGFKRIVAQTVRDIFGIEQEDERAYPLQQFLDNDDHGAEHVYNVYQKALDIADAVELKTKTKVRRDVLYVMIALHDSGRFHMPKPDESDSPKQAAIKQKKAAVADSRHALYGMAQLRFALSKLASKGITIDPQVIQDINNYIYNHDYMTPMLNGDRYTEPYSIEGQIARLADRISTDAVAEMERYWKTGKRLGTNFFNPEISFQQRRDFRFSQAGSYIKAGKLDQFMFFATLLAVKASDFTHPVLQEIYQGRAPQKRAAAEHIFTMAEQEGIDPAIIAQMREVVKEYSVLYEF